MQTTTFHVGDKVIYKPKDMLTHLPKMGHILYGQKATVIDTNIEYGAVIAIDAYTNLPDTSETIMLKYKNRYFAFTEDLEKYDKEKSYMKNIVENVKVYGLENSFRASKFPMSIDTESVSDNFTDTISKLAASVIGAGHDNFLMGIIVQFDLTLTNKAWIEAERYHFFDIVSSQSTMHRISKMDLRDCCNEYVTDNTLHEIEKLRSEYGANPTQDNYLRLLYNIPSGFRLTAGMTTNYRQLKTIYRQRRNHTLPEWRDFCKWIETLPYAELITDESVEKEC